jgi:hypothetical protein
MLSTPAPKPQNRRTKVGLFAKIARALSPPVLTNEQIIDAMEPWTLACAVGAENGTIGSCMGYDMWLQVSAVNWLPATQSKLNGASVRAIKNALRAFVTENFNKNYMVVLREQEQKRGMNPAPVLGPGESMTITIG